MTICERVFSLLADAGREQRELAKFIGVPAQTVSTRQVRGTNPGAEYIAAIAEFFSVSADYIWTGEEKEYRLSPADEEVLSAYHSLPRPEQVYILSEMYRRAGRISSPADRVSVGQQILCAIKSRDAQGLSLIHISNPPSPRFLRPGTSRWPTPTSSPARSCFPALRCCPSWRSASGRIL